jgi:hypothetical protein
VVSRINMMPTSSEHALHPRIPAREKLLGRKTDVKRDVRFEFGEFVQVFNHHNPALNTMAPRTLDAIALYPANDLNGSGYFLSLSTKKVFRANSWKPQPLSASIISVLESLGRIIEVNEVDELPIAEPDPGFAGVEMAPAMPRVAVPLAEEPDDAQVLEPQVQEAPIAGVVAQPDEPEEDVIVQRKPFTSDYNLRSRTVSQPAPVAAEPERTLRPRDQLQRPERLRESAFHISVKKSEKLFGEAATTTSVTGEIDNLLDHDTIQPVYFRDLTSNQKNGIIRSSIFLKDKRDAQNNLVKLKSRLVAGGDGQDRTLYSKEDTSSPTVATTSVLGVLAIAAKERRHLTVVDVGSAYLNADMHGPDVYMMIDAKLAEIFVRRRPEYAQFLHHGKLYVKLKKSLYGCIQSAKAWYDEVSAALREFGFTPNGLDVCVFNQVVDGVQVTVTVHVDDMLITTKNQKLADDLVEKLRKRYKTITVKKGKQLEYLGLNMTVNDDGTIGLDMKRYLDDIVSDTSTTEVSDTPATGKLFQVRDEEPMDKAGIDNFRTVVARLLFVGTHTMNMHDSRVHNVRMWDSFMQGRQPKQLLLNTINTTVVLSPYHVQVPHQNKFIYSHSITFVDTYKH